MKNTIPLYSEEGKKRTVWEVLKEVKEIFEKPTESYTVEMPEIEINKAEFTEEELSKAEKEIEWYIEKDGSTVKIHPVSEDGIIIHGPEGIWFFICRLLD